MGFGNRGKERSLSKLECVARSYMTFLFHLSITGMDQPVVLNPEAKEFMPSIDQANGKFEAAESNKIDLGLAISSFLFSQYLNGCLDSMLTD